MGKVGVVGEGAGEWDDHAAALRVGRDQHVKATDTGHVAANHVAPAVERAASKRLEQEFIAVQRVRESFRVGAASHYKRFSAGPIVGCFWGFCSL